MNANHVLLSSLLLGSLVGCDGQVDGDHQGTALAKLSGSVRNTRTLATTDAEVVVVWHKTSNELGNPDLVGTDTVEVEGSFPAQFKLSIYEPPDPALLNDWYGIKFGVAYIVSAAPGADFNNEDALLGGDGNHLLVYVPEDVPAGSALATMLRDTPRAGFHIYGIRKLTEAEQDQRYACTENLPVDATIQEVYETCGGSASFDDFVPLATDLDTTLEVELVDDIDDVEMPNWT